MSILINNLMKLMLTVYIVVINMCMAAIMAEWFRPLIISALNRSSHDCGFEPSSVHMWEKPSSACGWSGVLLRDLLFLPHLPIDLVQSVRLVFYSNIYYRYYVYIVFLTTIPPNFSAHWKIFCTHLKWGLGSGQNLGRVGKLETYIFLFYQPTRCLELLGW